MKPKLILCLALVLSGGFIGCSQNLQTSNETERVENNREIVRLANLIDPTNPPVTSQMLETGEFDGNLFDFGLSPGRFTILENTSPENTQAILIRFLKYSYPAEMHTTPRDFVIIGEDSIREKAADALIAMPSPAVVPVLRDWLNQGLAAAESGKPCRWGEVAEAVKGLGEFHDTTIIPLLVTAWQKGIFERKMDPMFLGDMAARHVRDTVIRTFVEMPSPLAKQILIDEMNDKRLDESIRYPVAAALVRLDYQPARDYLLNGLDLYLTPDQDTLESSRHNPAFYELQKLGDAKLISAIEVKAAAATRKRLQLVLPLLIERMRMNNLPMEELKGIALEGKKSNRSLPAIEILGEAGNADLLPFLESLTGHVNEYRRRSQNSQREEFVDVVKAAIRNVRLHNWQQLEKKP